MAGLALAVLVVAGPIALGLGGAASVDARLPPASAAGDAGAVGATAPAAFDGDAPAQATTPTNDSDGANATVPRHENPETVDDPGDLENLQQWLSGRMGEIHVDCAEQIQAGSDYVCDRLDEDHPDWASRFVDLAGETEDGGDDNASRVVNDTRRQQQEFANRVREFRETREAYREAKAAGEDRRARDLARELRRRAERVNESADRLRRNFDVLAGNSSMTLDPAIDATTEIATNASRTSESVQAAEFEPTNLTLGGDAGSAAFDDPAALSGRLTTAAGEPLVNRTVVVVAPDDRLAMRTDTEGRFAVPYRPTTARTGTVTVTAGYRPSPDSLYAVSNASATVEVRTTTATVEPAGVPNRTRFGEPVDVRGRVVAGDRPVPGIPVAVSVGGVEVGRVTTDDRGGFAVEDSLPAAVPAGERSLAVTVPLDDRAIEAAPVSASVEVATTQSRVTASATRIGPDAARVSGQLTAAGDGVPEGRLLVRRGEQTVGTARSGADGEFATAVSLSALPANRSAELSVAYAPEGGNLAPNETAVVVPPAGSAGDAAGDGAATGDGAGIGGFSALGDAFGLGELLGVALAVLVVGVAVALAVTDGRGFGSLAGVLGRLPGGSGRPSGDSGSTANGPGGDADPDVDPIEPSGSDPRSPLAAARERIAEGRPEEAIVVAYGATRQRLATELGRDPSLTHWELFADYADSLDDRRRGALQRLTELYERAAFSPRPGTDDLADDALDSASVVLDDPEAPDRPGSADD